MLDNPIRYLKGVGEKKERLFKKIGIKTANDLINYFPFRYQDRSLLTPISKLEPGYFFSFQGMILSKAEFKGFRKKHILKILVSDDSGSILCVWFNQGYLSSYFDKGKTLIFYGKVSRYEGILQVSSPEFELLETFPTFSLLKRGIKGELKKEGEAGELKNRMCPYFSGILPVYPLKELFTQRYFRGIVKACLDTNMSKLIDVLPFDIRRKHNLINSALALKNIHFPENHQILEQAYRRLAFEEFFLISMPFILQRLISKKKSGIAHKINNLAVDKVLNNFGFELTQDQKNVLEEIKNDMSSSFPMQRLLQGEVGSGKTAVSAIAAAFALEGGYQIAIMCPTEVLAYQHHNNFKKWFSWMEEKITFLVSSVKDKKNIYKSISKGKTKIIIGTHALLEDELKFNNLGLIIIDEQHKFGLIQRNLLSQKTFYQLKVWPDVLIMTATPIPRTLALTVYGDLDISTIKSLPKDRALPETLLFQEEGVLDAYKIVLEQVNLGRQAYIIYPIIEESLKLELRAAKQMYDYLRQGIFKSLNVGLIHGQLKEKEQKETMDKFKEGEINVLVATSILEVGIDVPNAACMVVEHAERFGLSQLHQLRGRIRRSQNKSFFILIANPKTEEANFRLEVIKRSSDGFEISQKDLELRGPGEFLGSCQHGLSELKIADPIKQIDLLMQARSEAKMLIEKDPSLIMRQNLNLKKALEEKIPNYKEFNKLT